MQNIIDKLPLDSDLYRTITKLSHTDKLPVSDIINRMLREHLNVYLLWRKVGYVLPARDILIASITNTPDEDLLKAAQEVANRHREACILLYGTNPNLDSYIRLIKSFTAVNNFEVELGKNGDNDTMIVQFRMN